MNGECGEDGEPLDPGRHMEPLDPCRAGMGVFETMGNIQLHCCQVALARIGVPPEAVLLFTRYMLFLHGAVWPSNSAGPRASHPGGLAGGGSPACQHGPALFTWHSLATEQCGASGCPRLQARQGGSPEAPHRSMARLRHVKTTRSV